MLDTKRSTDRGLSKVIGVTLLLVIVVLLVVVTMVSVTSIAESGTDASAVHGMGAYSIGVPSDNNERVVIEPQAVNTRSSTYNLQINGRDVYEWSGKSKLELTCLYPTDSITIYTEKGETTNLVAEYDVERALDCSLGFMERFEYAFVYEEGTKTKVDMKSEYAFGLALDPDGKEGAPGTHPDNNHDQISGKDIGPIPFSNGWHYSKKYSTSDRASLEGFNTPVWVFILVDNVHDGSAPTYNGGLNWTDPVPSGRNPGQGNYDISGDQLQPKPLQGAGEPTNDVYIVFKPGCAKSKMKIVDAQNGYDNRILMDGTEIAANVDMYNSSVDGTVFDAPGIPC